MDAALLTGDFKEFLRLLNTNRVDHLLVGSYAVGLHGYPRATVDLNVWVRATPVNAECVLQSLRDFGFDLPTLEPRLDRSGAACVVLDAVDGRHHLDAERRPQLNARGTNVTMRGCGVRQCEGAGCDSARVRVRGAIVRGATVPEGAKAGDVL